MSASHRPPAHLNGGTSPNGKREGDSGAGGGGRGQEAGAGRGRGRGAGRDTRTGGGGTRRGGESQPVAQLRGAAVQIDARRVGQVALGLVLATLAVLAVVFTVVGVHKNQEIDELHSQGVPVTVTVTSCVGLLGGSGSNAAGFSCRGSYSLDGHTYHEYLPGDAFHRPGSRVAAVAVRGDPALMSTTSILDTEYSSANVFVVPAVLLAALFVLLGGMMLWWRRKHRAPRQNPQRGGV